VTNRHAYSSYNIGAVLSVSIEGWLREQGVPTHSVNSFAKRVLKKRGLIRETTARQYFRCSEEQTVVSKCAEYVVAEVVIRAAKRVRPTATTQ
jgi:hypothetical protein